MSSGTETQSPEWDRLRFPLVCASAMSDEVLAKINTKSLTKGFGVGHWKNHFTENHVFPCDYVPLVLPRFVDEPVFPCSDAELFLRALNYHDHPDADSKIAFIPPIAARLAACLHVLSKSPHLADSYFQPGASATAQRHLSALLVGNPVLMHPQLRIPARTFYIDQLRSLTGPSMSIANAIALTRYARFPMTKDGFSEEQITAFANNRCTKIGLKARCPSLLPIKKNTTTITPFALALRFHQIRPALIASLHEIAILASVSKAKCSTSKKTITSELITSEPTSTTGSNPSLHLCDVKDYGDNGSQFGPVFAESFLGACGIGTDEKDVNHDPSPEFLSGFNEMRMFEGSDVPGSLKVRVLERIFGYPDILNPHSKGNSGERIAQGVHLVAAGLVAAGFVKTLPDAGAWLADRIRRNKLPSTSIDGAISFLRALDVYGATLGSDFCNPYLTAVSQSGGGCTPTENDSMQADLDVWTNAARIHGIETSMAHIIHGSIHEADVDHPTDRLHQAIDPLNRHSRMRI